MVKVIASSLTIGSGGMAGREGPMVQIGAAIGSAIGHWARLTRRNIRTLVACGAAGGVAATFNAPIAGAIFSMEVLMGGMQADFLLVLLTSLSSSILDSDRVRVDRSTRQRVQPGPVLPTAAPHPDRGRRP